MDSTQTMPSPVSPYDVQTKHTYGASRPQYPATPAPEASLSPQQRPQQVDHHEQSRGLGLTYCTMAPQSTISPIMTSPHNEWQQHHHQQQHQHRHQHHHQPVTSSQPPDLFTAEFDPFHGFHSASSGGMVGAPSPEAPGLEFCSTPPSSNMQSHRGSVSSGAPSETSEQAYTPRPIKGEENGGEWFPAGGDLSRAMSSAPLPYPAAGPPTLSSQTEDILYRHQPDWTPMGKNEHGANGGPGGYLGPLHSSDGRLPSVGDLHGGATSAVVPSAEDRRKKRTHTKPEEATHECQVCGKLFKRSYNYKSHLDTHNPDRKYPHPCTHTSGNTPCSKKFQRKTDLDRHIDSVHKKARNHKCALCGNKFARRDTLRRHSEDGCPKRFELGVRGDNNHNQHAPPTAPQPSRFTFPSPLTDFNSRPRSFSQNGPMAPPPPVTAGGYAMYSSPSAYRPS